MSGMSEVGCLKRLRLKFFHALLKSDGTAVSASAVLLIRKHLAEHAHCHYQHSMTNEAAWTASISFPRVLGFQSHAPVHS